jgi:hypothetical protein
MNGKLSPQTGLSAIRVSEATIAIANPRAYRTEGGACSPRIQTTRKVDPIADSRSARTVPLCCPATMTEPTKRYVTPATTSALSVGSRLRRGSTKK